MANQHTSTMSEGGALARLSPAQIKQLQRVFYALDRDEDGNVSESDLAKALRSLGARDAPTEAKEHFQADVLGSDAPELDATSFLTMMATRMGPVSDARKLLEAFESFDERDEGVVDVDVVKEILANDQEAVRVAANADRSVARAAVLGSDTQAVRVPKVYVASLMQLWKCWACVNGPRWSSVV